MYRFHCTFHNDPSGHERHRNHWASQDNAFDGRPLPPTASESPMDSVEPSHP